MLFLFSRGQEIKAYDFVPYYYGCFSFQANQDIVILGNQGLLTIKETEHGRFIELVKSCNYLATLDLFDQQAMLKLKSKYEKMSQMDLIKYTYVKFPFYAINSRIASDILSKDEIESYVNEKLGVSGNSGSDINISEENLEAVKEGMRGVTSDGSGTAYSYFKDFNVEVGGKTGSATTDNSGNANAWFVGFAPYDDPEIAVAVYIKDGQHGASTAVTAREIFAQYFGMNSAVVNEDMTAVSDMQTVR